MEARRPCLYCFAELDQPSIDCPACGRRDEPRLRARWGSLRPKDVRFDRRLRWVGIAVMLLAVPIGVLLVLGLGWEGGRDVAALLAYLGLLGWIGGVKGVARARKLTRRELETDRTVERLSFYLLLILPMAALAVGYLDRESALLALAYLGAMVIWRAWSERRRAHPS